MADTPIINPEASKVLQALLTDQKSYKKNQVDMSKLGEDLLTLEKEKLALQKASLDISNKTEKQLIDIAKQKEELLRKEKDFYKYRTDYEKHLIKVSKVENDINKNIKDRDDLERKLNKARSENKKATDEEIKQLKEINLQLQKNKKELEKRRELAELIRKEKEGDLDSEEKAKLKFLKADEKHNKILEEQLKITNEIARKQNEGKKVGDDLTRQANNLAKARASSSKELDKQTKAVQKQSKEYEGFLDRVNKNELGSKLSGAITGGLSMFGTGKILKGAWNQAMQNQQASIKGMMVDYTTMGGTDIQANVQATNKAIGSTRSEFIKMGYSGDEALKTFTMIQQTMRGNKTPQEVARITKNVGFLGHALQMTGEEVVKFQADMEQGMGMTREEAESTFVGIQSSAVDLINTLGDGSYTVGDFKNSLMSVVEMAPGYNKNVKLMAAMTKNLIIQSKKYGATQKEAMAVAQKGMGMLTGATVPEWAKLMAAQGQLQDIGGATDEATLKSMGYGSASGKLSKYLGSTRGQELSEYERMQTMASFGSGTKAGMKGIYNVIQKTLNEQGTQGAQAVLAQQFLGGDYGSAAMLMGDVMDKDFEAFAKGFEDMKPTDTVDELKKSNEFLEQLASTSGENSITQKLDQIVQDVTNLLTPMILPIIKTMNMFLDNEVGKMVIKIAMGIMAAKGLLMAIKLAGLMGGGGRSGKMGMLDMFTEGLSGRGQGKMGAFGRILGSVGKVAGVAAVAYAGTKMFSDMAGSKKDEMDSVAAKNDIVDAWNKSSGDMAAFSKSMEGIKKYWGKDTSLYVGGIGGKLTKQFSEKQMDKMAMQVAKDENYSFASKIKYGMEEKKLKEELKAKGYSTGDIDKMTNLKGVGAQAYMDYQKKLQQAAFTLASEGGFSRYQETGKGIGKYKSDSERALAFLKQSKYSEEEIEELAGKSQGYKKNIGAWQSVQDTGTAALYTSMVLGRKGAKEEIIEMFTKEQKEAYSLLENEQDRNAMIQEHTMDLLKSEVLTGKTTEDDILDTLLKQEKLSKKSEKWLENIYGVNEEQLIKDSDIQSLDNLINAFKDPMTMFKGTGLGSIISNIGGMIGNNSSGNSQGDTNQEYDEVVQNADGSVTYKGKSSFTVPAVATPKGQGNTL